MSCKIRHTRYSWISGVITSGYDSYHIVMRCDRCGVAGERTMCCRKLLREVALEAFGKLHFRCAPVLKLIV